MNGLYGPLKGGGYQVCVECNTWEEANRVHSFLSKSSYIERRLELAEEALRDFAHHSSGVMAPNAKHKAWRDFINSPSPFTDPKPLPPPPHTQQEG